MTQTNPQTNTVYEYVSGYCRTHNGHRMVECTFLQSPDGQKRLEDMDCDFHACPNHSDCVIAREAAGMED